MSLDNDLWRSLYQDVVKEAEAHRIRAHEKGLRVIALEGQRRTLIAHLKWAALELVQHDVGTGKHYLNVAQELEQAYVEEPKVVLALRTPAGEQQPDTGSEKPAGHPQTEANPGDPQGYIDLPAAVRQQQWDR